MSAPPDSPGHEARGEAAPVGPRARESSALVSALRTIASRGAPQGGGLPSALLTIAVSIWLLDTGRPILLPLTLGLLLSLMAWPAVRLGMRMRLSRTAASAAVVLILVSAMLGSLYGLSGPAADWIRRAPTVLQTIDWKLHALKRPIEQIQEATEAVKEATRVDKPSSGTTVEVAVSNPTAIELMLKNAPGSVVQLVVTLVALFFFLAWGDGFMQRAAGLFNDERLRTRADAVLGDAQRTVSHYLSTVVLINAGLGTLVGALLLVLGYPNPVLWGFSVALLNFAPFVGGLMALIGITVVGLVSFDTLTPVLIASGGFALLTAAEGYFVTPAILGRRLSLDPLAIFLSIMVWGWLWGPLGLLMAVPLLVCLRIIWLSVAEFRATTADHETDGAATAPDAASEDSAGPGAVAAKS